MSTTIIKPDPDVDLYVEWSSISDCLTRYGTRAQWIAAGEDEIAERLVRADLDCSILRLERRNSIREGFVVQDLWQKRGYSWLPRKNLLALVRAIESGSEDPLAGIVEETEK